MRYGDRLKIAISFQDQSCFRASELFVRNLTVRATPLRQNEDGCGGAVDIPTFYLRVAGRTKR